MQVPHRDAEWDALVQLIRRGALWHRVHRADQFIASVRLFVEQGSRSRRIELHRCEEAVAVIREVIFRLRNIRHVNLEAVIQNHVIVEYFSIPLFNSETISFAFCTSAGVCGRIAVIVMC